MVQPCVVTLEPVQTRIDVDVTRLFVQDYEEPEEAEIEMPEDDRTEPLGAWIDPAAIMIEALALEIPEYPRADGAELGQAVYTKPGDTPMTDEDARPFAEYFAPFTPIKVGHRIGFGLNARHAQTGS